MMASEKRSTVLCRFSRAERMAFSLMMQYFHGITVNVARMNCGRAVEARFKFAFYCPSDVDQLLNWCRLPLMVYHQSPIHLSARLKLDFSY